MNINCEYCDGGEQLNNEWLDISIENNKLIIGYDAYSTDSSFLTGIRIKYCPMCGKKLKG